MSDLQVEGEIPRNATDSLIIQAGQYWKINVVDIRWFKNDKPTSKGVRFNFDEARKVNALLTRILENGEDVENSATLED